MSIPAAVLVQMATLGLDREQAEAVASMLAAVEEATRSEGDAGKEKARARWRRWRESHPRTNDEQRLQTLANGSQRLVRGDARVDDKTSNLEIEPQVKKEGDALTRDALDAYAAMAGRSGLAVPRVVTSGRRTRLQAVVREHGLPAFLEAVAKVGASSFCCGVNDRGWKADLDFILQAKSFTKILEGHYDDRKPVAREGPVAKPATIHELLRDRRQEFADHVEPTPNGPRLIAAR